MLDALKSQLCLKLCRHNIRTPITHSITSSLFFHPPTSALRPADLDLHLNLSLATLLPPGSLWCHQKFVTTVRCTSHYYIHHLYIIGMSAPNCNVSWICHNNYNAQISIAISCRSHSNCYQRRACHIMPFVLPGYLGTYYQASMQLPSETKKTNF